MEGICVMDTTVMYIATMVVTLREVIIEVDMVTFIIVVVMEEITEVVIMGDYIRSDYCS
ncbi:hypothetical protein L7F22_054502, partial [Adiantum nelumboides]|nr:hypothetical protein [Adiantum nelumboides]